MEDKYMSFFSKFFKKHQGETQQTKQTEAKTPEIKQSETKHPETKQSETKQPELNQAETKQSEAKQPETKQSEVKRATTYPSEPHYVVKMLLSAADTAITNGDYSKAADAYKKILVVQANITAQYNLGQLYLQGKGVEQNYVEAAKLFRVAAEFGNDGYSQNSLAILYNTGSGVEKNDLAALYWFDRATDNGVEAAKKDRDGIFNAYRNSNSPAEFDSLMQTLSDWCKTGTADIPQDAKKAAYWLGKTQASEKQQQAPEKAEDPAKNANSPDIIELVIERLLLAFHTKIPATGTFESRSVTFGPTATGDFSNLYVDKLGIIIEPDTKDKNNRWLRAAVTFFNSDYVRSAYILKGTSQELEEYLNTPEARNKIKEVLLTLDRNARNDERLGED